MTRRIGYVLCLFLMQGSLASAQDIAVRLEYRADSPTCPTRDAFRDLVVARAGVDPFDDRATAVLQISIAGENDGAGSLRAIGSDGALVGERSVSSSDCEEVAASLAIAAAILLDPGITPTWIQPIQAATAPASASPTIIVQRFDSERPRPATAPTDAPPGGDWSIDTSLEVEGLLGLAPAPLLGVHARSGVHIESLFIGVAVHGATSLEPASAGSSVAISASALLAGPAVCGHYEWFWACGEVLFGGYFAEGSAIAESRRVSSFISMVGPSVGVVLPLASTVSWEVNVAGFGALIAPNLTVGGERVFSVSPVIGAVRTGFRLVL